MMMRIAVIALAALALPAAAPAGGIEVLEYIGFDSTQGKAIAGSTHRSHELEIDSVVDVTWRRDEFLVHLAEALNVTPPGDSIAAEIEALETLIEDVLRGQAQWLHLKALTRRILDEGGAYLDDSSWRSANKDYAATTSSWTDRALEWENLWGDPRLQNAIDDAIMNGPPDQNLAEPIRAFLEVRLAEIANDLARRIEAGAPVSVLMEARIRGGGLGSVPIHLDGYDNVQIGDPVPFERFQIAVDKRTRAELDAAARLGSVVDSVLSGSLKLQVTRALDDLRGSLEQLRITVRADVLQANLDQLIVELEAVPDSTLIPLADDLRDVRDWVRTLAGTPELAGDTDAEKLASLSILLDQNARSLVRTIKRIPRALELALVDLATLIEARPGIVSADLVAAVEAGRKSFLDNQSELLAFYEEVHGLTDVLGLTGSLANSAENVGRVPRKVGAGVSLDTWFDLQTISGTERHAGDRVQVTVKVMSREGNDRVLAQERQEFTLQAYGPFIESRGGLLFVDPRSSIGRDLSYQPTVGLGIHMKYGFRNAGWWNDWLRIGVGVSFALLDFEDDSAFELGVAGSVTLLKDLFWVGYGRNLQARADYFYIAISPLALGSLR